MGYPLPRARVALPFFFVACAVLIALDVAAIAAVIELGHRGHTVWAITVGIVGLVLVAWTVPVLLTTAAAFFQLAARWRREAALGRTEDHLPGVCAIFRGLLPADSPLHAAVARALDQQDAELGVMAIEAAAWEYEDSGQELPTRFWEALFKAASARCSPAFDEGMKDVARWAEQRVALHSTDGAEKTKVDDAAG
jgi:hypothetical protein